METELNDLLETIEEMLETMREVLGTRCTEYRALQRAAAEVRSAKDAAIERQVEAA